MERVITPIFATLTYVQSKSILHYWQRVSRDSTKFMQRLRQSLTGNCEYLRAFEQHKSGYPHVHYLLLPSSNGSLLNSSNRRYIADGPHRLLKSYWSHGHTDFQPPRLTNYSRLVGYVLKEISKSTSATHLNQLLLSPEDLSQTPPVPDPDTYPKLHVPYAGYYNIPITKNHKQTLTHCTYTSGFNRIKLLTWSRNFVNTYKTMTTHTSIS